MTRNFSTFNSNANLFTKLFHSSTKSVPASKFLSINSLFDDRGSAVADDECGNKNLFYSVRFTTALRTENGHKTDADRCKQTLIPMPVLPNKNGDKYYSLL